MTQSFNSMAPCEQMEVFISGYIDGELTQQESQQMAVHIRRCESCEKLYKELVELKGMTKEAHHITVDERDLPRILENKTNRWLMTLAWALVIIGGLVVGGFMAWDLAHALWTDTSQPWWLRLALGAFYLGFVGLFLVVLRQRLIARKTDKYRKVKL